MRTDRLTAHLSWLKVIPLWLSLISGVSSTVREIHLLYSGEPSHPITWFWASVWICFVLSSWSAYWLKQREVAELENIKTKFAGKIKELYVRHLKDRKRDVACLVILNVSVQNKGQTSSSIAGSRLSAEINGKNYHGKQVSAEGVEYHQFQRSDVLSVYEWELRFSPLPVGAYEQGHIHEGWLAFLISDFDDPEIRVSKATLFLSDAFDVEHPIEENAPWGTSGTISVADWREGQLTSSLL